MASPLILKRTSVPGRTPSVDNIDLGQIAFNTYDGRVFIKKSQSGVESIVELTGNVTSVNGQTGPSVSLTSDNVPQGSTNLYYSNELARAAIDGGIGIGYDGATGTIFLNATTSLVTEGTNLYFTVARARSAISGSTGVGYNSSTGVISIDTSSFVTLTGAETVSNKTLDGAVLKNVKESPVTIGNTGTAKTIDLTNGSFQIATLTGNCTFTMPSLESGKYFTLLLKTGTGGFTATFTNVKFPSNTAPSITSTANRADLIAFVCDGVYWYGNFVQNYSI